MSFRTRILLLTAAVFVLVLGGVLVGIERVVRSELLTGMAAELDGTAQAVGDELKASQARLSAESRVVGEEPRLKAVVFTAGVDRATRDDVAKELRDAIGWDVLAMSDAEGKVVAWVAPPGISSPPTLAESLEQGAATGYWIHDGRLFQMASVRTEFRTEASGALFAGVELGDARSGELSRRTRAGVAFFADGRLVSSSLADGPRAELATLSASLPAELALGEQRFLTRTVELDPPRVRLAVLESAESALAPYRRLQRAVLVLGAAALVLALGLAALLAQSWSRPVAGLVHFAQAVKSGDLSARASPAGGAELAGLATTLNEMVGEIARQRRRDELATFLVHDLKNPLTSVLGFAQVLESSRQLSEENRDFAKRVVSSAEVMLSMVMDLLDVGRESDGSLVPKKSVIDLHELVGEVARESGGRAQRRNLTVEVDPQGPRTVRADRELLRRVLENLLDNAFKYAPNSGRITLQLRPHPPAEVVVRVCDEGPGVPAAYRTKVFDTFFRLDRHAAEEARTSRGLGLSFCRLAVEAHQGRIWVEDHLPKGSAFCFSLPTAA